MANTTAKSNTANKTQGKINYCVQKDGVIQVLADTVQFSAFIKNGWSKYEGGDGDGGQTEKTPAKG